MATVRDYPETYPLQFKGSVLASALLKLGGWKVSFSGLPALQGVIAVYPHTSNWDFIVMMLAKWTLGLQVRFWGKDMLFRIPLFGPWLSWVGGVPVDRTAATGATRQALDVFAAHKARGEYFWLGLAPEGTRKFLPGLRSGFYRTALGADVPLALIRLDYGKREVRVTDFIHLTGDVEADMARIASVYEGVQGRVPRNAAPLRMLDAGASRADTIGQ